jgi:hypothetical protein
MAWAEDMFFSYGGTIMAPGAAKVKRKEETSVVADLND